MLLSHYGVVRFLCLITLLCMSTKCNFPVTIFSPVDCNFIKRTSIINAYKIYNLASLLSQIHSKRKSHLIDIGGGGKGSFSPLNIAEL